MSNISKLASLTLFLLCSAAVAKPSVVENPRSVILFDRGWQFHYGDIGSAAAADNSNTTWRNVDLPHDWSIEGPVGYDPTKMDGPFDKSSPAGAAGAYLNGGVGWYKKVFSLPDDATGKHIEILFDAAYMDSDVWINGHFLGNHPYGYTSFYYDLTPYLNLKSTSNEIVVRLDVNQPCSRWYSGAGLYRNVWLIETQPVQVAPWGVYVTTPVITPIAASVKVCTEVDSDRRPPAEVSVTTTIYDDSGRNVAQQASARRVMIDSTTTFEQTLAVPTPRLWSTTSPTLYYAVTDVSSLGKLMDSVTTPFGIRSIDFTVNDGFLLNGQRVQIHGVCDHGDLGCLGTAALRRGLQRQLEILKGMGCNAIRTSHNPPSPQFLDLCDQMGFLVMDEAFDEWKLDKTKNGYGQYFDQWSQSDLDSMLLRDRNHPSIIIWSVGNEVTEGFIEGGAATALPLVATCHTLDPSRPVTSAAQQPYPAQKYGFDKVFDVFGINYTPSMYQEQTAHGVEPLVASETASQVDTRGQYGLAADPNGGVGITESENNQLSSYDLYHPVWATNAEAEELALKAAPWIAGEFVWTGFDYLGEPTPFEWPSRSSYFGIVDLCGFPKARYYFYKSQWSTDPVVHILPHWTWPGLEGKTIPVRVYTNADTVELFLNGKSLGVQRYPQDCERVGTQKTPSLHLAWNVPYEPGELKAVGSDNGIVVQTDVVHTAGQPAKLLLTPDRSTISGDGYDLSFVKVSIEDKNGVVCPDANEELTYSLEGGAARIAGVDDGDPTNHESFQGTTHAAFHGFALVVVRSNPDSSGSVTLTASSPGLTTGRAKISISK